MWSQVYRQKALAIDKDGLFVQVKICQWRLGDKAGRPEQERFYSPVRLIFNCTSNKDCFFFVNFLFNHWVSDRLTWKSMWKPFSINLSLKLLSQLRSSETG